MKWLTAPNITSTLSLVGFAISAVVTGLRVRLRHREKLVSSVDPKERAKAIQSLSDAFHISVSEIDAKTLTSEQAYALLASEIRGRDRRFNVIAITSIVFGALFLVALWLVSTDTAKRSIGATADKPIGGDGESPPSATLAAGRSIPDERQVEGRDESSVSLGQGTCIDLDTFKVSCSTDYDVQWLEGTEQLSPGPGAKLATLGRMRFLDFDSLPVTRLFQLAFSENRIPVPGPREAFAVLTDRGDYAKVIVKDSNQTRGLQTVIFRLAHKPVASGGSMPAEAAPLSADERQVEGRDESTVPLGQGMCMDLDTFRPSCSTDYDVQWLDGTRQLAPGPGAKLATLGRMRYFDFDSLSITRLRRLKFSDDRILMPGPREAFAVLTDRGDYAKVIVQDSNQTRGLRTVIFRLKH